MVYKLNKIANNPALAILLSYIVAIFLGGIILYLPFSTNQKISFTDAIFTATSAFCVTGLSVQDTGKCFTLFGQWMIVLYIQLGGIGILTFSAFILRLLSGRMSFHAKSWLEDSLVQNYAKDMYAFVKKVLVIVISVEFLGAMCLFFSFIPYYKWQESLYFAVFHAISAFCNAGFSTFGTNLELYRASTSINIIIMTLVILGSTGYMVIEDVRAYVDKRSHQISFHSKIVLTTSAFLILFGGIVTFTMEYHGLFASYSLQEKILASLFHSVSCRTAGFNTVPVGAMSLATLFFSILLMFIGGSPGSMAGGIKTTSFALLFFQIKSRLQGRPSPEIFHRTVSIKYMDRVMTLLIAACVIVIVFVFFLLVSENNTTYVKECSNGFMVILFEVVSALGTAGLSMGITPFLSAIGKWAVLCLMLIGKIGPLSLAIFLMSIKPPLDYQYPEEEVMIG